MKFNTAEMLNVKILVTVIRLMSILGRFLNVLNSLQLNHFQLLNLQLNLPPSTNQFQAGVNPLNPIVMLLTFGTKYGHPQAGL